MSDADGKIIYEEPFFRAVSSVAGTVAMARLQIAQRNFDAVLLDINMEGEYQPETADVLLEADVPFAFVTGYDYVLEPRHEGVPLLEKPFGVVQLRVLLEKLVGPGSPTGNRSRGISACCDPILPSAYLGARRPTQSPTRWR